MNKQLMAGAKAGAWSASKEKDPSVSIAIPKAPPMKRVSPGVYRDAGGNLVKSKDGQRSERMPMGGGLTDLAKRLAGDVRIQPVGEPVPGGIADSIKMPPAGPAPIERRPVPNRGGGNIDDNIRRILDMFGRGPMGRPIPKQPMNIDPGFQMNPSDIPPELRRALDGAMNSAAPQIPRSGGSISDMLRRR